jgi:hypothetical protein
MLTVLLHMLLMAVLAAVFICALLQASSLRLEHRVQKRAIRRTINGLCPMCGYDLRATPAHCPECGTDIAEFRLYPQRS